MFSLPAENILIVSDYSLEEKKKFKQLVKEAFATDSLSIQVVEVKDSISIVDIFDDSRGLRIDTAV